MARLQASEHILLESDARDIPEANQARRVHATFRCNSRMRRRSLELAIIDYYYLSVRSQHGGSRQEYVLDLRFVDNTLGRSRHVPWRCLKFLIALAAPAALSAWYIATTSDRLAWDHAWDHAWRALAAAVLAATACTCIVCLWRFTESLTLLSVHGGATLLKYTGGVGTLRAARQFARKISAHIQLAIAARRASLPQHLRDEMREHYRLREAGVLSHEQYEASKARILARHAPATRARAAPTGVGQIGNPVGEGAGE